MKQIILSLLLILLPLSLCQNAINHSFGCASKFYIACGFKPFGNLYQADCQCFLPAFKNLIPEGYEIKLFCNNFYEHAVCYHNDEYTQEVKCMCKRN